ncbi:MAG: hypothetical protein HY898_13505 [Deltaproteobacteria bacterium]|nr:hypothetical protein [Deltaproteobacteria bacterium]
MFVEVVILGTLVVGGVALYAVNRVARGARDPIRRCTIRDAEEGRLVRIVGEMKADQESIRAPLSGREVLAYDVTVAWTQYNSDEVFHTEGEAVPFLLSDDSGLLRIDPCAARFEFEVRTAFQGGFLNALAPRVVEYLKARSIQTTTALGFNVGLMVREWVLEPGDTLAVIGIAHWESDPSGVPTAEPGYRDTAKRLRVIAPPDGQVLLTARPERHGE